VEVKRMLTCYGCDKRFATSKPNESSIGDTKAWCNKCYMELNQFRRWVTENENDTL